MKRKVHKDSRRVSAFTRSLYRHGDPANYALHMVALPFFVLGLVSHRVEFLAIGVFYVGAGSVYAYVGAQQVREIWVTLFHNDVNKWFTLLAGVLVAVGLWGYDIAALLFGVTIFLFGLLYTLIVGNYSRR